MTLETVLFWKKKHNTTLRWFEDSVFFSCLDNAVQSCISREFWSSMLVMIVELMLWGRKSRTLLLLLLVLHGKRKLIKLESFSFSSDFCIPYKFSCCDGLQWLSLPTLQDYYTWWSRFNDRRCPGILPHRILLYVINASDLIHMVSWYFISFCRMLWGVPWRLTPKWPDSFLYANISAGILSTWSYYFSMVQILNFCDSWLLMLQDNRTTCIEMCQV